MKNFYLITILVAMNICSVYASAAAGNNPREFLSITAHGPRQAVTPSCDPLVDEKDGAVHSKIKTPSKTVMGLNTLYSLGLSGEGVRVGVVETSGTLCNTPGLLGAIITLPETGYNIHPISFHWMEVSQVIASQQTDDSGGYIGFAPNAEVVFGVGKGVGILDTVKRVIRQGAVCLNLSIALFFENPNPWFLTFESDDPLSKGDPTVNFVEAINFAIDRKIPVFLAGGNDKEVLGEDPFLTKLLKRCSYNPLLQIVFGWEPRDEVFFRDDIQFAKDSARGIDKYPNLSRFALSCPYSASVIGIDFDKTFPDLKRNMESIKGEKKNKVRDENRKKAYKAAYENDSILFTRANVSGTSFSAPALASIYALLYEYANKGENKGNLQPEDIMACLQGTAYMPTLEVGDGQDYAWFGSGIPDCGRARLTMDYIAKARLYVEQKHFANAVIMWEKVITNLKDFAQPSHIFEALEAYYQSQQDFQPFFNGVIDQLPTLYQNHRKDRKQCLDLLAQRKFEEFIKHINKTIHAKIDSDSKYLLNFEEGLITFKHQRQDPYFVADSKLMNAFDQWKTSFLSSEIASISKDDSGDFFEANGGRELFEPYLACIKKRVNKLDKGQVEKISLWYLESSLEILSSISEIKLPKDLQDEVDTLLTRLRKHLD